MGLYSQLAETIKISEKTFECIKCHKQIHYLLILKNDLCYHCSEIKSETQSIQPIEKPWDLVK